MTPDATLATATGPSFDLSEDQQAVREMVRDFAESEIRPIASAIDESHEFPLETTRKMGELGLMGMFVPEAYGGAGTNIYRCKDGRYVHFTTNMPRPGIAGGLLDRRRLGPGLAGGQAADG